MNDPELWNSIEATIGSGFKIENRIRLSGGSINSAYRIDGGTRSFFVKLNQAQRLAMFEAEFEGLQAIQASGTLRVPNPIALGSTPRCSFLVLEYIDLKTRNPRSDRMLGERLAEMHRRKQPEFGWTRDNTIGSTLQVNSPDPGWVDFWRERRLNFQLSLAKDNGCPASLLNKGAELSQNFDLLYAGYSPARSLLHGDLWSGNAAADEKGEPLVFDPACYIGDRECDIAMTELFGGFGKDFYAGYEASWSLDPGYRTRKNLYNLYHVLNHFNLFGGGYLNQAESMIQALLAEIR